MWRFCLKLFTVMMILITGMHMPAFADRGGGGGDGDRGYQGPRQLSAGQANISGGCNCGTTVAGTAASSALAFAPLLGMYAIGSMAMSGDEADESIDNITEDGLAAVAHITTTDHDRRRDVNIEISAVHPTGVEEFIRNVGTRAGQFQVVLPDDGEINAGDIDTASLSRDGFNVRILDALDVPTMFGWGNLRYNRVVYEDLVAVVEIERVGNDLYMRIDEVRTADVSNFISSQNQPDNEYQVITAVDYFAENEGTSFSAITPDGYDVRNVQMIELPPEETYEFLFFVEPGGRIVNMTDYTAALAAEEDPDDL